MKTYRQFVIQPDVNCVYWHHEDYDGFEDFRRGWSWTMESVKADIDDCIDRLDLDIPRECTCPTLDGIQVTGSSCPVHGLPSTNL